MRRETQDFKEKKQLLVSIDMHCSHVRAHICYYSWLHHRLFINRLKTVSFVFFFLRGTFLLQYADLFNQRDFFFTVHSFYEYVLSNKSNKHERKKSSQQEQLLFFNALLFSSTCLFLVY